MLGKWFLGTSVAFVVLLAVALYQDGVLNRPYGRYQQQYFASEGVAYPGPQVYQLFPKVKVNGNYQVERCITCHVPDILKVGPQEAARKLGSKHPAVIDDKVFAAYGHDTMACRPAAAAAQASPSPSASPSASASPVASASPKPSATPSATPRAATPAVSASGARCLDPKAQAYYVLDVNGKVVNDPQTGQPMVADLPGFITSQYKGLGIDESGCIICHNGQRLATTVESAHRNLIPNPFAVFDQAPNLYENSCAQCHGATGEGLKGPPLNDQDRLGFFNDEYYQKCIYLGYLDPARRGTIMPPWGVRHILNPSQIQLLVHWIRLWQDYTRLP
jgi:mono/diheme cytochrome c family protein